MNISQVYETFVQCLSVNKCSSDLCLDETINDLILEEKRRNEIINVNNHQGNNDQVFYSKVKGNKRIDKKANVCFNYNKEGNFAKNCKFEINKCFNCNKMGHISTHCRLPKFNKDKNGIANRAKEKNEEFFFHTNNDKISSNNVWLLDSSALNHTCFLK